MTNGLYLALYGLLFLSGCFMLPAWLGIMGRAKAQGDGEFRTVAGALALNSGGTAIVFGFRLLFGFETGNWTSVGGIIGGIILGGLVMIEASKVALMTVRRGHGHGTLWRWYAGLSVAWTLFALGWIFWR